MAESSTITLEMIEAAAALQGTAASLQRTASGRHRTPGIEQSANVTRRVQKDVGSSHLEGVLGSEACQRFFDLAFDFVHQSQAFSPLAAHMVTSQHQEGSTGEEKSDAIRFLGRFGRCIVTGFLAQIPAWHRSASLGCYLESDACHCAPHTTGKTAYRSKLIFDVSTNPNATTDGFRLLVALKSVSAPSLVFSTGGARG